jgi:putative hydrolase of HD superfamily
MELEEALLLFEELQKEDQTPNNNEMKRLLIRKISEMPFEGLDHSGSRNQNICALINFFLRISSLLSLKRTGWVRSGVRDPERVSGHMFRMGLLAFLMEDDDYIDETLLNDVTNSPMVISVVHDLAECVVGDITPHDNVSDNDKHRMEVEAMENLVSRLPPDLANLFKTAFNRYENANAEDKPAQLTKDLDKFDMVVQAFEYEEKEKRFGDLEDFFVSTSGADFFKHPTIIQWNSELRILRKQKILGKQINNSNDKVTVQE